MKIILTGSLGHISRPLTQELLQKGHTVTVISSKQERRAEIEALGAVAAIGSIEDVAFLTATFIGADAVYTMIPPPAFMDVNLDAVQYCSKIAGNYAKAVVDAGVKRVVHLSSIGAHMHEGSGLILMHHAVEKIWNTLPNVAVTFMRPTAFHYNLLAFIGGIKSTGMMASNYGGSDVISWVAPADIATAIADEIVLPLAGRKVRYVASDELTCTEVASILGAAIGKPDLQWMVISDEQLLAGFTAYGMAPKLAAGLVEMNAAMHTGALFADYNLHRPGLGKTKLTSFAKDFAAAFNK